MFMRNSSIFLFVLFVLVGCARKENGGKHGFAGNRHDETGASGL